MATLTPAQKRRLDRMDALAKRGIYYVYAGAAAHAPEDAPTETGHPRQVARTVTKRTAPKATSR